MKRKTKIMISALSVMLLMALSVTALSLSFADDSDLASQLVAEDKAVAAGMVTDDTNIDLIIANSETKEDIDHDYHIVEIGSGDKPSNLSTLVSSDGFKNYVIDGYSTKGKKFDATNGKITYDYFQAKNVTSADLPTILKADFIYLSNASGSAFGSSNDLPEDLYDLLHVYAVGSYKPLVIDSPSATSVSTDVSKSMAQLGKSVFSKGYMYYTFSWNGADADNFLGHGAGSLYLGIHANDHNNKWIACGDGSVKVARILAVSPNGTTTWTKTLLGGTASGADLTVAASSPSLTPGATLAGANLYAVKGQATPMGRYGYNTNYGEVPDYMYVEQATLADASIGAINLSDYDMIVLESDCASMSKDVYKKLSAAMYANYHIVYSSTAASSPNNYNGTVTNKTNFEELYYMVAYENGTPQYENIFVTTREDFDDVVTGTSAPAVKVVADLINKSNYRGNGGGGGGSTSNKFSVLEIQPCYPIDENVAAWNAANGKAADNTISVKLYGTSSYYNKPAQVVNGKTKEEIPANTEYYAWELSKGKIADALGLDVTQVSLTQMSTEELASSKTNVLGNYDLVYVGGNTSALKPVDSYVLFTGNSQQYIGSLKNKGGKVYLRDDEIKKLPVFEMYSHFGPLYRLKYDGYSARTETTGVVPIGKVEINGKQQETFGALNGNDITDYVYKQLKAYVEAGMPVIVSEKASVAYRAAKTSKFEQNSIDPESNMYLFLNVCDQTSGAKVLWDFDQTQVAAFDSNKGKLGQSLNGKVSLFATDEDGDNVLETSFGMKGATNPIADLYAKSNKRPKVVLTSSPALYSQHDVGTKLSGKQTWIFKVTGATKYKAELIIDDNGNSSFEDDGAVASGNDVTKLEWNPGEFFGPFYWQLRITALDDKGGATKQMCVTSGLSYIKNKESKKQDIRVLQIMPSDVGANKVEGRNDGNGNASLYFCPVCQQSIGICHYNPFAHSGTYDDFGDMYNGQYYDTADGKFQNIYFGKHEHQFGIVYYDSTKDVPGKNSKGCDDWDINLADEVSDLYNFDIDILYTREFENYAKEVRTAYDTSKWSAQKKTQTLNDANRALANDEEYRALTTDADRIEYYLKVYYKEQAALYRQLYEHMVNGTGEKTVEGVTINRTTKDAKLELDLAIDYLETKVDADSKARLERIKRMERYYDYYNFKSNVYYDNFQNSWTDDNYSQSYVDDKGVTQTVTRNYNKKKYYDFFSAYTECKDKELEYKELAKMYERYAAGENWLAKCYDSIVIGPCEEFNFHDDISIKSNDPNGYAITDLEDYVDPQGNNGNVLLFHDSLTKFSDDGSVNLTKRLKGYFGMDRYQATIDTSKASLQTKYVPYKWPDNAHRIDNISYNLTDSKYADYEKDYEKLFALDDGTGSGDTNYAMDYFTATQYTDAVAVCNDNDGMYPYYIPYKYAVIDWETNADWYKEHYLDARKQTEYGTNHASQNNKGIVTLFPFTLSDELKIGGTHPQAYALDLEDENCTVWYSMVGGDNDKYGSSFYAADPRDGMDNYFIYSYGNVNYCGAGHSKVTGWGKDNNDERRLYINIICNSVRKSVKSPVIELYDHDSETNSIVKPKETEDAQYEYKVDEDDMYPEFSFKVTKVPGISLKQIQIYYDLDYSSTNRINAYSDATFTDGFATHVLIADWDEKDIKNGSYTLGALRNISRDGNDLETYYTDPAPGETTGKQLEDTYVNSAGETITFGARALKLKPRYFSYYNNEYTYIVVAVKYLDSETNKTNTIYKRMKIILRPYLYDLT